MMGAVQTVAGPGLFSALTVQCRALGALGQEIVSALSRAPVSFESEPSPHWFNVSRAVGIQVFTDQADALSLYTGLSVVTYCLFGAVLGLAQWRALMSNAILIEEDFRHGLPSRCVFATQPQKCDYALVLENPSICFGCIEFYRCLGAEPEIITAQRLLKSIRQGAPT